MKFIRDGNGMMVFEKDLVHDFIPVINDFNKFTGKEKEFEEFRNYIDKTVKFSNLKVYSNNIKETFKNSMEKTKKSGFKLFSITLPLAVGAISTGVYGGENMFWDIFMEYIFPVLMDIAKVYCVIKIAQGFYEERKGSAGSGSAMQSLVEYGKWYLLFMSIPIGVELVDEVGRRMLEKLLNK